MLVVRLKRIGKKNKPTYRLVVAEHSAAVNGSYVEDLGFYNPHSKQFSIDRKAVTDWLNKGAKPSNTVARLLEKEKVKHKSIVVIKYHKAPKKKEGETKPVVSPAATIETSAAVEAVDSSTEDLTETDVAPAEETEATVVAEEPVLAKEPSETSVETHEEPIT